MPSAALQRLSERLSDVDDLMRGHEAIGGAAPGRRFGVEGINRAAVVMLSAHLEGYVEDLFSEALTAVHGDFNARPLTSRFHNPWPDQIDSLFTVIGLQGASRNISWQRASSQTVISNLESLVRMRNQIAHGNTEVAVAKATVTRFRTYVEGFAQRLDTKVALHLFGITRRLPWVPGIQ